MINQHRQSIGVVQQAVLELQEFIAVCRDAREVRKALAIKLIYQGYLCEEIQTILDVSLGSIAGWKQAYLKYGIEGLRLNHKGRKSYLNSEQLSEILSWLQTKNTWELAELDYKLAFEYDVIYSNYRCYDVQ